MASAPPDERVYTDFKDEARTCPTNMKFKTTNERIQLWVKALEEIYPDVKLWDYKQKTKQKLVSLKIRDTDNGNLIIKFHLSTGVVVIQGSQYQSWGANEYASIKARVNALSDSGAVLEKPSDQDAVDSSAADPSSAAGHAAGLIGNRTADDLHPAQNSDTKRAYHDIHTNHVSDGKVRDCDEAISKLEVAYFQLCDNTNDNLNNLKSEMLEIKAEIRKMPLKIMDLIKKDIKGINNSVSDMVSVISESESYKAQINQLTEQLQHQCKDMWKLQRSLAAAERTAALLTTASRDSTMTSSPTRSGSTGLSPSPAIAPSPTTESSAMGGDRTTSREAIVSHTPDRDSNPVPSSPNIPNGTLPHHEAVTTGTEDPDDDGVHRGSAASGDLAADAVAPAPLGSQASAPGPDMVSQLNDDSVYTYDGSVYTYCSTDSSRMSHSVRRMQAHVLRGPTQTTTIWPGEYIELPLPDTMFPNDDSFAIEPRSDCAKSPSHNPEIMWPTPSLITSVGGKIRIPNLTEDPVIIQRNSHFCQVRHITVPTPCDNFPCPKLSSTQTGESLDSTCDIRIDPDNILPCDVQDKFGLLHQDYNTVFRRKIQAYNGMSGPIKGEVNMGPTEPPQRKGRLPLYCRDKLVELQEKFDELEEMGVFRRPEDINISVEYLNPSFLVRKPNGGFRLVTAFADVGRYSKPQPSLMPDVDSTLRTIARWKHIITTDLTKAFYQIPLSNKSMKYCGVVTPFRGVRVYARCAMGMPGSETALEELMCRVLGELLKDGVVAKIADDLYCGGDTPEELFHNWQAVLSALHANNLTLAGGKTVINPKSTVILGWVWQQGTLQASSHRIATLSSCDAPKSVRGLRSYLGAYKVLARVLPNCAKLIAPLDAVIGGHASSDLVPWTSELRDLFAASQAALSKCRVITLPLPSDQLWIVTDGAVKEPGLGSTLYVSHNNKVFIAGFFSAKLRKHQVTWLPCEIEALCIAASVKHFSPYIVQSTLKACVLTDSKPCVQAYEKLCRGEFSSSPRVSTFLSVASRFQTSIRHVSGAANVVSDFASRNAPECHEPNCQVCNFVIRTEDSVVRAVSVQEVLQGSIRLPFTSRAAWLLTQRDCPDLRRTQAHLRQGTRPSRKITDVRDVKRYLQVAQIARDGLLVVSRAEPLSPAHECIIIPRQVLDGLLSALHLKLNHPTRHQLKTVMSRYFYALDLDKAIERVSGACHLCASLQRIPNQIVEQTSLDPPETVGVTLSADIIKRARQLILVLRECVTSYTIASLVTDETHHSLRDALISLCIELRPVGGPPAVIRTDPAPGFVTLQDDSVLRKYNITLEIGRVKNPNKNPVADKGIQELEHELQRLEPSGGPITRLTLSIAVSHLNTRIRGRGLSAREMMFQRDQFNNRQIPVHDRELILQQHHQRTANHHHSAVSKSPHGVLPSAPDIDVGSLVYLHNDGNKHQARPRYLVTEIDGPWCSIKKFTGNQLRSTSYRVKRSECYIVPSNVPSPPSDSYGLVMGPSDNHVEQSVVRGPPVPPTPPVPPGIPREISLPAVTGVTDGGDHVPQVSCPRPVPPEPPDFAAGDPAVQPPECGEEISSVDSTMMSSHSPDVASAVLDSSALDTATPRHSSRPTHKPSYLQDYVCN